jgi:hypothetical protein
MLDPAKLRFARLRKNLRNASTLVLLDDVVEINESPPQPLCERASHRRLASPHEPDEKHGTG